MLGYGKHFEDKDQWVGSLNSRRGLVSYLRDGLEEKISRKKEINRMAIRYIQFDESNCKPWDLRCWLRGKRSEFPI